MHASPSAPRAAITIRPADAQDVPGIFHVRVAVRQNRLDEAQLRERGVTPASVVDKLERTGRGWVAVDGDAVVGFSIADAETCSIWALFVLPAYEGQGLGRRLLDEAVAWLRGQGGAEIWLVTDRDESTRANGFYRHLGWSTTGEADHGDARYVLRP